MDQRRACNQGDPKIWREPTFYTGGYQMLAMRSGYFEGKRSEEVLLKSPTIIVFSPILKMGFWQKIFNSKQEKKIEYQDLSIPQFESDFGRFTDANKVKAQYDAWDKSVTFFEQRDYQLALDEFLHYIENPTKNNITRINDQLKVYQGSKAIEISIKNGQFSAECAVAHTNQLHIGFMRRLLDLNYELKYVRYALSNDDTILLMFETLLQDSSPYKLYFALKELAIHADKQDDLLLHEFDFLSPIHSGLIHAASHEEKLYKIQYFKYSIQKAIASFDQGKLKMEQYPAAASYLLLALLYKMDYLVKPEGKLMDRLDYKLCKMRN
jgi:hypothetical protein